MPMFSTFPQAEAFDWQEFREDSRQLDEFRGRDFSSMAEEVRSVLSHATGVELRFLPVVWRLCRDMAVQYVRKPSRRFVGGRVAQVTLLEDIYRRIKSDAWFLLMQQRLCSQNSLIASIDLPRFRSPVFRTWAPWESCVEFDDPLEEDISRAREVRLLVPIGVDGGTVIYGERVYTQTEAWTESHDEDGEVADKVALFPQSADPKDFTHNFDGIPLRSIRREQSLKGIWYPPLPLEMLAEQIGLNIDLTDVGMLCRFETYGRESLTGPGALVAADQMVDGPDRMRVYPADADYSYTATDPKIGAYMEKIERGLKWLGSFNYSSVDALTDSRGITGAAKRVDRQDQVEERERAETMLRDFEQDVLDLLVEVLNASPDSLVNIDPSIRVAVDFHYVEPVDNALQSVQARQVQYQAGEDSPAEFEARRNGRTLEDAQALVDKRTSNEVGRRATLGLDAGSNVPGLDRLDNNA